MCVYEREREGEGERERDYIFDYIFDLVISQAAIWRRMAPHVRDKL